MGNQTPGAFLLNSIVWVGFLGLFSKCRIIGLLAECAISGLKKFSTTFQVSNVFLVKRQLQHTSYGHWSQKSYCIKQHSEKQE